MSTIHRLIIDAAGPHKLGLQTPDPQIAERWMREAMENAKGHLIEPHIVEFEPMHGAAHGLEIVRSVHRLVADVQRHTDGSVELRGLYHYPHISDDDMKLEGDRAPAHPLITKRQWVKVPALAARSHRIVPPKE